MSEQPETQPSEPAADPSSTSEPATEPAAAEPTAPRNLTELLALLPEDQQNLVKGELNAKRTEARKLQDRVKALEPKAQAHDEAQEAAKTAEQRAEEQAAQRASAAEERARKATERSVRAEVHAAAADRFANPANAAPLLGDLTRYCDDDGEVDTDQIAADVDALLGDNPHLKKSEPTAPRAPAPNPAQGSSGAGPAKTSGTDVGREMYASRRKKTRAS